MHRIKTTCTTTLLALSAVLLFSGTASAKTVCGQGTITLMEHEWGDKSAARIKTQQMPADVTRYKILYGPGYVMEMGRGSATSAPRWDDRMRLMELAVTNKLPVQILSRTTSCVGEIDDFDIALCDTIARCSHYRW